MSKNKSKANSDFFTGETERLTSVNDEEELKQTALNDGENHFDPFEEPDSRVYVRVCM